MATIADKLTYLNNTKTAIKDAIVAKGVSVADSDTFRSYADKIGQIETGGGSATDEWQPNPNWWDIRKILDEDTRDYPGKVGVILYNFNDVSDFTLSSSGMTAVATSDGAFYTYADNGANVSHNWDTAQDKDDGGGFKTRWVIYYYTTDTTSDGFGRTSTKFGWEHNNIAYLVLRINISSGIAFCGSQHKLEAINNIGYTIQGTSFSEFCSYCFSLQKLPDNFDTSNCRNFTYFCRGCYHLQVMPDGLDVSEGTDFRYFCYNCPSLRKLPDNFNTRKGLYFSYFCYNCYSLLELPDGLDTSQCDILEYFCYYCYSLRKLPDNFNTSKCRNFNYFCQNCTNLTKLSNGFDTSQGTAFTSFLYNCQSLYELGVIDFSGCTKSLASYNVPFGNIAALHKVSLILPSSSNFWLNSSTRISIESFRYIADHAPDVTATPRTLTIGKTNISRINAADPTIITDLNARGWTVA